MKPENRILALSAVFLVLYASPARAHGMKIFATAEGSKISGYAYFIPKGRPKNVLITVFDSAGNKLGETRTDEQGNFTFVATKRCDHVFVLNNGDGHKTRFVVSAEELPEALGEIFSNAAGAKKMGVRARESLLKMKGATDKTLRLIAGLTA